jgi:uroporphyrinogen III methyltransferase/synthase
MAEPGIVTLVGAGPGDPGLLTVRGLECLRQAEVVVYDFLANPELLALAPSSAERICVGKRAGAHTLRQEEINALLVERGKAGQRVVRLKGGDPFVFGRGGEEALALRRAGVPVEVVPGITSGIAAPAYAGIPVTQRGMASVVSLVTGHEDPGKQESSLDWAALARGGGTLVFYMGVGNLPAIVRQLLANGRPADTPVAVVARGTLPVQEVVEGTLANIVERMTGAGLQPPAVTVVGEVVALRRELAWFEARPLFGRTVVVTRSRTQASGLAEGLTRLGARVLSLPTIAIEPPDSPGPLGTAVDALAEFDWLAFTSVNGVERLFAALARAGGDSRRLAHCRVAAVGPATVAALRERGIVADLVPARATSVALSEALREQVDMTGLRVLLPGADIAPPELPDSLRAAGAVVTEVVAYRTVPVEPDPEVVAALRAGEVQVVTFTSSSTVRNYVAGVRQTLGGLPPNIVYASIGPETSRTAAAEGIRIAIEAAEHTVPGLLAALTANATSGRL